MSFGNWQILWLLFIPAAMLVWIWMRRQNRVVLPQDFGTQRRGLFWHGLVNVFQSFPALLLAVAIILLAGPRQLGVPRAERELTNIEFCLDLSGSMTSSFGVGSRYDAAMEAINEFIKKREGDAFGLTIFGTRAEQWLPLTTDPSGFEYARPFLRPEQMPGGWGGGTRIGRALRKCKEVLTEREEGDRMIILVSDGVSSDLHSGQDEEVARELKDEEIVMYGIHIGGGGVPSEVASIATITGGRTFSPQDQEALKAVFYRIDQMQITKMRRTYAELMDRFWPFSIAGLCLLGMTVISFFGLRYTPW